MRLSRERGKISENMQVMHLNWFSAAPTSAASQSLIMARSALAVLHRWQSGNGAYINVRVHGIHIFRLASTPTHFRNNSLVVMLMMVMLLMVA